MRWKASITAHETALHGFSPKEENGDDESVPKLELHGNPDDGAPSQVDRPTVRYRSELKPSQSFIV